MTQELRWCDVRPSRYRTSAPRCGILPQLADISYQTFLDRSLTRPEFCPAGPRAKWHKKIWRFVVDWIFAYCDILMATLFLLQVFQSSWLTQAQILTDAVADIVTVEDFLFVSESHILEDVNRSDSCHMSH